jgi:hypothetical protein
MGATTMRFGSAKGPLGEFNVKLEKRRLIGMPLDPKNYENMMKAIK